MARFNPQINKLKCVIQNGAEVTLKLFHQMLPVVLMMRIIFNTHVSKHRKAFANGSSPF